MFSLLCAALAVVAITVVVAVVPPSDLDTARRAQDDIARAFDAYRDDVVEVQKNAAKTKEPHYAARGEILSAVPLFWYKVMHGHAREYEFLTSQDSEVLKYMTNFIMRFLSCPSFNQRNHSSDNSQHPLQPIKVLFIIRLYKFSHFSAFLFSLKNHTKSYFRFGRVDLFKFHFHIK